MLRKDSLVVATIATRGSFVHVEYFCKPFEAQSPSWFLMQIVADSQLALMDNKFSKTSCYQNVYPRVAVESSVRVASFDGLFQT